MASELGIDLRGSTSDLDVQRVLRDLGRLVRLLGLLEDAKLHKDRKAESRSTWSFTNLGLGSVKAVLAPLEPRGGANLDLLSSVPELFVSGFSDVETTPHVPDGWNARALREAERATRSLGVNADRTMVLTLLIDGEARRTVEVTHQTALNATAALQARRISLGSVIGTLDSVSVHRRKRAGLWTARDGRRVEVTFDSDHLSDVANYLGHRVEVWGRLSRNADDQVLSIHARRFIGLRSAATGNRLTGLRGIAPDLTGGLSIGDYLEDMRGTS